MTAQVIKIKITADHIRNGRRGNRMGCPVYLGLTDAGYRMAEVTPTRIACIGAEGPEAYRPSPALSNFPKKFDCREVVQPGELRLTPGTDGSGGRAGYRASRGDIAVKALA